MISEQDILNYLTEKYSHRKEPVKREWTFQEHFNFIDEELDEILADLFTRYHIAYDNFDLDNYFTPEKPWWSGKQASRQLKPLTVEMIIKSAIAGRWLYD